jgi:hypothetical protein
MAACRPVCCPVPGQLRKEAIALLIVHLGSQPNGRTCCRSPAKTAMQFELTGHSTTTGLGTYAATPALSGEDAPWPRDWRRNVKA